MVNNNAGKIRQIAIAIDPLSTEVNKTIEWTMENFLRPTDEISAVMVMVLDSEFNEEYCELPPTDSLKDIEQKLTMERLNAMDHVVNKLKENDFQVKSNIIKTTNSNNPCQLLIEYLDSNKMDCLIMGTRNLSGWKRFFMGSFSDYVQSHTNCPVLIVK